MVALAFPPLIAAAVRVSKARGRTVVMKPHKDDHTTASRLIYLLAMKREQLQQEGLESLRNCPRHGLEAAPVSQPPRHRSIAALACSIGANRGTYAPQET